MSFVASTGSEGSSNLTLSESLLAGDLGIWIDIDKRGSLFSTVVPTGFTPFYDVTAVLGTEQFGVVLAYKILVTGDISSSKTGISGTGNTAKLCAIFRPSSSLSAVIPQNPINFQFTANNPPAQNILAAAQTPPLINFGVVYEDDGCNFTTVSPSFDGVVSSGAVNRIRFGYKIYNTAPANQSVDSQDYGDNFLASGYIRVS